MGKRAGVRRVLVATAAVAILASACTGGGRSVDPAPRVVEPTAPAATADAAPVVIEAGWQSADPGPLTSRFGPAVVWTGDEVVIWGGRNDDGALVDGAAFDPVTRTWRLLSPTRFAARAWPVAAWTGAEMIVIGGVDSDDRSLSGAAAYDPAADSWREVDLAWSAIAPFSGAVWTGQEVVVVGAIPPPTGDPADVVAIDPVGGVVRSLAPYGEAARRALAVRWDGAAIVAATIDDALDVEIRRLDPVDGQVIEAATLAGVRGLDVDPFAIAAVGDAIAAPVHYASGAILSEGEAERLGPSGSVTRWPAAIVGDLVSYGDVALDVMTGEWVETPLPDPTWDREFPTAVSTGSAVVVWGGNACGRDGACDAIIDPAQTLIWSPA